MKNVIADGRSAAVIDSCGAQLLRLRDARGMEYIWQRDLAYWANCAPVLFPTVGGLKGGRAMIEGKPYAMIRHGFAREREFRICERGGGHICFLLRSDVDTRSFYPFAFELRVGFTLSPSGLCVEYSVKNVDKKEIYFGLGGHPGINCPLGEGESFEDYQLEFETPETVQSPIVDENGLICFSKTRDYLQGGKVLALDYSLFEPDAVIFEGLRSRSITLRSTKSGRGVRFGFSGFHTVAFWTPAGKRAPFICFEPWSGMGARDDEDSEDFAAKKGIVHLPAGEEFKAQYSLLYL